nr:MAG TPA: hypothetical protein [Caudoviricetes sp.]
MFFLSCDGGFLTVLCSSIRHAGPFTDGPERRAAWPEISTGTYSFADKAERRLTAGQTASVRMEG